ncbi:MAG: hypothetical protein QOE90_2500 [Thermoplasmata archaeon]|jgi:hypothetical protein|nr:hypothetical protein [Thermoplasmata archaeon]
MLPLGERPFVRGAPMILVLLALPLVAAQPGPLAAPAVSLMPDPPKDPIQPLAGAVSFPVRVHLTCDASNAGQPIHLAFRVTRSPAWATPVLSPTSMDADGSTCAQQGGVDLSLSVNVQASDQAPAFVPDALEIDALADEPFHATGETKATTQIAAGYFSIIDASAPETERGLPPGGITTFPVDFTNMGNGATKIVFETATTSRDVIAVAPTPIVLQSKQTGGTQIGAVVPLQVHRAADSPRTQETVTLRWRASYALDGKLAGDSGVLTFVVGNGAAAPDTRQQADDALNQVKQAPGPGLGMLVPALAGLAMLARRLR